VHVIARSLAHDRQLLVTIRPDDDVRRIARTVIDSRGAGGFIIQIGRDPGPSLQQVRTLAGDRAFASGISLGLQLAPGLIDTDFTCASLAGYPDIVAAVDFLKAEYNSIDLQAHLAAHPRRVELLVGRHGQNVLEYLEIGAVGIIPATEMTPVLVRLLGHWRAGEKDAAFAVYGKAAAYIDFAMQDLDTLIEVGRASAADILGLARGRRRRGRTFDAPGVERTIARWTAIWRETCC
jgi:hypothetical protein